MCGDEDDSREANNEIRISRGGAPKSWVLRFVASRGTRRSGGFRASRVRSIRSLPQRHRLTKAVTAQLTGNMASIYSSLLR